MTDEGLLLKARPSGWNFLWHWIFFWLIIPLIVALWKRAALVLHVYDDRVVLERGVLSKAVKEIFISDVRTIDTKQTFFQRLVNVGDLMIATAGTSGYEDIVNGLPDPGGIKDLIISQRRSGNRSND
jgi:uncharacterized membrane protein YdbT with pleckstrin-like domain